MQTTINKSWEKYIQADSPPFIDIRLDDGSRREIVTGFIVPTNIDPATKIWLIVDETLGFSKPIIVSTVIATLKYGYVDLTDKLKFSSEYQIRKGINTLSNEDQILPLIVLSMIVNSKHSNIVSLPVCLEDPNQGKDTIVPFLQLIPKLFLGDKDYENEVMTKFDELNKQSPFISKLDRGMKLP